MAQEELITFYDPKIVKTITDAGQARRMLRLVYRDKSGHRSVRRVEPYSLKNGGMYAYDPVKASIRFFKLSRIVRLTIINRTYTPRWPVEL